MLGRLYDLPFGFPALVVPEEDVRTVGTTDYRADAEIQHSAKIGPRTSPPTPQVYGELLVFDDPEERLPSIDELEGFHPGGKSFYKRVLIPTTLVGTGETLLAWAYAIESASGTHLPGGRWPAP